MLFMKRLRHCEQFSYIGTVGWMDICWSWSGSDIISQVRRFVSRRRTLLYVRMYLYMSREEKNAKSSLNHELYFASCMYAPVQYYILLCVCVCVW